MKIAKNFVKSAIAKRIPEIINNLNESLRIAYIPTSRVSRLKKRHCTSMRKLLVRARCHGVSAKMVAANVAVGLPYKVFPSAYTKMVHPSPIKVIRATPISYDKPKIWKNKASV